MEDPKERLSAKIAFFCELNKLDAECIGVEKRNEAVDFLMNSKKPKVASLTSSQTRTVTSRLRNGPLRTLSSPVLPQKLFLSSMDSDNETSNTRASAGRKHIETIGNHPAKALATTFPAPSKKEVRSKGKRKRRDSLNLKPESQQIFKGQAFYFFPNSDISPARKFRIRKALEWGAIWVRDWKESITHVIVDNGLSYKDVVSYLKLSVWPANIVLVNENYPAECISYRFLVNPVQGQYRVPGQQEAIAVEQTPPSTESSLRSLVLKGAKTGPPQTPSRTEGSNEVAVTRELELVAKKAAEDRATLADHANTASGPEDALEEAIREAKELEDLPIDDSEDDNGSGHFPIDDNPDGNNASDEEPIPKKPKTSSQTPANPAWQKKFACMATSTGTTTSSSPNAPTVLILQKMADYYASIADHWRIIAYRKAISALRSHPAPITTYASAIAIPTIGHRLALKIAEIATTSRLRALESATTNLSPADSALQLFLSIHGVGVAQATAFVAAGHRSLADLPTANLTAAQSIGVAHHSDFQTRIPRAEITQHAKVVRAAIDPRIEVTIGGSYRRGAADSGDVDFILVGEEGMSAGTLHTLVFDSLVPQLYAQGYLRCALAATSKVDGRIWQGAATLPGGGRWRRVDLLLVPWEERGAAFIYFTGDDIFNRSMRLLARKKGFRLNQRGLWRHVVRNGGGGSKGTQGVLVEGASERRIFEILGVPWKEATERKC